MRLIQASLINFSANRAASAKKATDEPQGKLTLQPMVSASGSKQAARRGKPSEEFPGKPTAQLSVGTSGSNRGTRPDEPPDPPQSALKVQPRVNGYAAIRADIHGFLAAMVVSFMLTMPAGGQEPSAGDIPPPQAEEQTGAPIANPTMQPLQGSIQQRSVHRNKGGKTLNGEAENSGAKALTGGADRSGAPLTGGAQGWPEGMLQPMGPGTSQDPGSGPMQGFAGQNPYPLNASGDPDESDQELQVQWDLWRNTLIHAIQMGTLAKINVHNNINFVLDPQKRMMVSRYPLGLSAWYTCEVLPNGRIVNFRLTQPTQYPSYDQAVLQAINDLQGNKILRYPKGSKRQTVTQEASVRTAGETQMQNVQFGDVETQRYHQQR